MSSTVHPQQEKLLELAYGELSASDAKRLEVHLQGCPRCAESLSSIHRVRQTMSQLPTVQAPERGMESLLAYAEQAARRARSGPAGAASWWSRLIVPAGTAVALVAVVVVGIRVSKQVNLSPAADGEKSMERAIPQPAEVEITRAEEAQRKPSVATSPAKAAKEDKPEVTNLFGASPPSAKAFDRRDSLGAEAKLRQIASAREVDSQSAANKDLEETKSSAEEKRQQFGAQPSVVGGIATPRPGKLGSAQRKAVMDAKEKQERGDLSDGLAQHQASNKKQITQLKGGALPRGEAGVREGVAGGVAGAPMGIVNGAPSRATQPEEVAATGEAVQVIAGKQSRTIAELSDDAAKAKNAGDRRREVAQLRQALASGAEGQQRADLLYRLCDALYALGERAEAKSTCNEVERELPNSEQAAMARQRKNEDDLLRGKAKAAPAATAPADALKAKRQPSN